MYRKYEVNVGYKDSILVGAKTPGAAARKVFRMLIRVGYLKRQPRTDCDGWFEGVSIRVVG